MNTTPSVTIALDESTKRALITRLAGQPLSPEAVASALLNQFAHHAPPEAVAFLVGQRGGQGNLFAELENRSRSRQRQELAEELQLADLVRKIATKKDRQ